MLNNFWLLVKLQMNRILQGEVIIVGKLSNSSQDPKPFSVE